jgi:hypothetical protein
MKLSEMASDEEKKQRIMYIAFHENVESKTLTFESYKSFTMARISADKLLIDSTNCRTSLVNSETLAVLDGR